jgi:hypothetical protein
MINLVSSVLIGSQKFTPNELWALLARTDEVIE